MVHHKAKQDPFYKAMGNWNTLPVNVRNNISKEIFEKMLVANIINPYKTFV